MRTEWLRRSGGASLIVFFNGWGMDAEPLRPLTAEEYDVLVCSEYGREEGDFEEIRQLAAGYERRLLVCWSMGVYFGQLCFRNTPLTFEKLIAVNGTLRPIDDDHGIPGRIFQATLENLSAESLERFYRRMCRPGGDFALFSHNRPRRSVIGRQDELAFIGEAAVPMDAESSIYTDIVIAEGDLIIPAANQLRFWRRQAVKRIEGPHFPFYRWRSWEALVAGLSG